MQAGLVCSQIRSICSKTKHICPQISPICPLPLLVGGAVCCNSCVILCAWKTKWYFQIYLGPAKPSVSFFRCAGSLAPIPVSGPDSHTSFWATLGTSYMQNQMLPPGNQASQLGPCSNRDDTHKMDNDLVWWQIAASVIMQGWSLEGKCNCILCEYLQHSWQKHSTILYFCVIWADR